MTEEERDCAMDFAMEIDEKATKWVNSVGPALYKELDRAEITYSEDLLCESLSDGFKAGYIQAMKDEDSRRVAREETGR